MLFLNMPLTIILPIKSHSREWTVHIRTSEKGPRKEFRVATLFVPFQIVSLTETSGVIGAIRLWTLVWSIVLCSRVLT
jgi:hypothetical protein